MGTRDNKLPELEERLGYRFRNRELLAMALTHMSDAIARGANRGQSYQRLEFLGDRVLGLVVADLLVEQYPKASEGELSQRLAAIVRKETCAAVAADWQVGPLLRLGASEVRAGGRDSVTILGDVCEAIIGAVFIDAEAGYETARALIKRSFASHLRVARKRLRDAKTLLQEWAQASGRPTPNYSVVSRSGPDHAPAFVIAVEIKGFPVCHGEGKSKRDAEQSAAGAFIAREGILADGEPE